MNQSDLQVYEGVIVQLISEGWSYDEVSEYRKTMVGDTRGMSSRTLRRYCAQRGIRRRGTVDQDQLDRIVRFFVTNVGHSYGRRTMHGLLSSQGIRVNQTRLAASLQRVAPVQYAARRHDTNRMLNPAPYHATYFGEKLHLDQSEKCVMFSITHVVAIDGYSRKIVGLITIPKKNATVIYDLLFQPLLHSVGLWDQLRVDHGTEFALIITAQQHLSQHRQNRSRQPVLQSLSRQNHRAERIWPEVNRRINYPFKCALIDMENREKLNMGNDVTRFCVSWVTIRVMQSGIERFVAAWNSHRIPGPEGGIPNELASRNSRVTQLNPSYILSTSDMVQFHEQQKSALSRDTAYGSDPLTGHPELQQLRERGLNLLFPDMDIVFQGVLHGDAQLFENCLCYFIHLTNSFASLF